MAYAVTMVRNNKPRSGVTLGGIGTGGMELRQDGLFYHWSIFNNYPLGVGAPLHMPNDSLLFFVVRYQEKGKEPMLRLLQIENDFGAAAIVDHPHYYVFPWISGVDKIEYSAVFPRVRMKFSDAQMPFEIALEAWSPFIPHDVKNSALPAVLFDFTITPKTANPVDVMLMASMRNAVAYDVPERVYASAATEGKGYKAFELSCTGVDPAHSSRGTMGIASLAASSTYYLGWEHRHPYYEIVLRSKALPNINDTAGRNMTDQETGRQKAMERCFATIANSKTLRGKKDVFKHTFAATWHFPNRYAENVTERPKRGDARKHAEHIEGHYYANFFATSSDVAAYVAANAGTLRERTNAFLAAYYASTVDTFVLDQVNSNLNTFVTSAWLTKDGNFGVIEGIDPHNSYAGLGTMDVAMYGGVCAAALFPELDRGLMKAHRVFQNEAGKVAHSILRNFRDVLPSELSSPRLDMPSQYAYMTLRAGFWSGDLAYLREMWPSVKKAIDYVLRERDMNKDGLPDMEGIMCSYDNFPMYGAASYVASQFLAAVAAAVEAARLLGDAAAHARYAAILEQGKNVFEEKLWNGACYRLYNDEGGPRGDKSEGCLADQIIGQWAAQLIGCAHFLDRARVRKALLHVMAKNYHPYYGLRNCTWPGDTFLHDIDKDTWVDQANTAWTGVELAFASFLIYEGLCKEGLALVKNIDDRYRRWGIYWDHQEFGGHYFRPMSAWSVINALLGLAICNDRYTFAPRVPGKQVKLFFSFGHGTATYQRAAQKKGETIAVVVHTGAFTARELRLEIIARTVRGVRVTVGGRPLAAKHVAWQVANRQLQIVFAEPVTVKAGRVLEIAIT